MSPMVTAVTLGRARKPDLPWETLRCAPTLASALVLLAPVVASAATGGPDTGGYTFTDSSEPGGPVYDYDFAPTLISSLPDDGQIDITLPFTFTFYAVPYTVVSINSNGVLAFGSGGYLSFNNSCGPSTSLDLAAPFWDDLNPADVDSTGVYHGVFGTAPNRYYVVEWWNIDNFADTGDVSLEVKLFEADGSIEFHYSDVDLGNASYSNGASATVGLAAGSFSQLQYSCDAASLSGSFAIRFEGPGAGGCTDVDADGFCDDVDCDDSDPFVYPGALEMCDGGDDDCDGQIDEGFDADGDGVTSCGGDCDDSNPAVGPTAFETCNGIDDNCDSQVDEGFDADGDGVTTCGGDCDDSNAAVSPGASETCNGLDDDCDGLADEGFDSDGDGVTTCGGDCDDANAGVSPSVAETCNSADDDCDGLVDEGFDSDGDGYTTCGGDCNDADAGTHPGANEVWDDGVDQDCDGADSVTPGDDDDSTAGDDDDSTAGDDDDSTAGDDDDSTAGDDDDSTAGDDDDSTAGDDDDSTAGDDDDSAGFPSFEDDDDDMGVSGEEVTFGCMCSTSSSATPSTAWLLLGLLPLAQRRRR